MKIKRFFAPDMRQAIRQVREALGSDAVILSNKSVDGGVELVAAKDYDESVFYSPSSVSAQILPQAASDSPDEPNPLTQVEENWKSSEQQSPQIHQASTARIEWSQDPALVEMRREMQVLRRVMENGLSELSWYDLGQRSPQTKELLRRLMALDLSPGLCQKLADQVQDATDPEQLWNNTLRCLSAELPVAEAGLLEYGGVAAVIGPTGVGKTTTVAKLAARFCLRHGNRHIALISTDNFRIGAQEQLHDYARILDVPVRAAADADQLNAALSAFSDKRLVLIDTAGMSQQDASLGEQLNMLVSGHKNVHCFLTLSATTQQSSLALAIKAFGAARPDACILTKVDETASLGGVFSALIQSRLPLAFSTDGQRVPEDLHVARAHSLVNHAVTLGQRKTTQYNDDYLAIALGGASGHAHV
jgi:flagellar biosynthesis protein FlhF